MVEEQWANLKFRDWRWATYKSRPCCVPSDTKAYLRELGGAMRHDLVVHEKIYFKMTDPQRLQEYMKRVVLTAESISVPPAGQAWDGKIDVEALKELCQLSVLKITVEEYVQSRHYSPLLKRVKVGTMGWEEWVAGKGALACIADAMAFAATQQVPDDDLACMRQVVIASEKALVNILAEAVSLSEQQAYDVINVLKFDQRRKKLEIWDQPLIPCGGGLVFMAPALITTGSPARALENFISQWDHTGFSVRGPHFEMYLADQINAQSGVRAVKNVKLPYSATTQLQFDLIAWWDGYIILIEAKCEKAAFSPADYYRAQEQIEKSIDQLILRRRSLKGLWDALRNEASELGLPASYVGDDKILCISITNIMDFTGYSRDGVVVTDDLCFLRFFGGRMLQKFIVGHQTFEVEDMVAIRESETPSPQELMAYLQDPPQMRRFLDRMEPTLRFIPPITTRSSGFYSAYVEFKG